ncbi:MAG: hypothetical protein H5T85_06620 [Actinobacteria bacterium]|nr:hypothetical protein [Actinomycetota bacterium]
MYGLGVVFAIRYVHFLMKVIFIKKSNSIPEVYLVKSTYNKLLSESTSGGVFRTIVETFCDRNYVIFGVAYDSSMVFKHSFITSKNLINKFQGSKYVQSDVKESYKLVNFFLKKGIKVLFFGTPCQIAGLRSYLNILKYKEFGNLFCVKLIFSEYSARYFLENI